MTRRTRKPYAPQPGLTLREVLWCLAVVALVLAADGYFERPGEKAGPVPQGQGATEAPARTAAPPTDGGER